MSATAILRAAGICVWAGLLLVAAPAAAQPTDDRQTCTRASGDTAIAACTRAIASGQFTGADLATVYYKRGWELQGKGDHVRSVADFTEAIRLDPGFAMPYFSRGATFLFRGDNDRAIADFDEAIRLDGRMAVAYLNRGVAYRSKGDDDRALADYNEVIRLDPGHASAYNNRGNSYQSKGDQDRAIADFDAAIRLDPRLAQAFSNRGLSYYFKGDAERAIADYSEAIRLDPKGAPTYAARSRAYFYAGMLPAALADATLAGQWAPNDAHHALWFDIVRQRNGAPSRLPTAVVYINMTVWPAPVIRMYLGQLTPAQVLAAADHPNAAVKARQVCEANFYAGALALRQGARDEAVRLFRSAASDCPVGLRVRTDPIAELKALGETP